MTYPLRYISVFVHARSIYSLLMIHSDTNAFEGRDLVWDPEPCPELHDTYFGGIKASDIVRIVAMKREYTEIFFDNFNKNPVEFGLALRYFRERAKWSLSLNYGHDTKPIEMPWHSWKLAYRPMNFSALTEEEAIHFRNRIWTETVDGNLVAGWYPDSGIKYFVTKYRYPDCGNGKINIIWI